MSGKVFCAAFTLTMTVLVAIPAISGPTPAPVDEPRISAEEATARAVNKLTERGAGFHLRHPRREVDFTPDGVRVTGKRGAPVWTWSLERVATSTGRVLSEGGLVAPVAVEPTLIRYDRCLMFEDYRLKQNSVEQLLVIPEPLSLGGDDLVVTGKISCGGELGEDEQGWTWRGDRGEVTLGRVTVLDADGAAIPATLSVSRSSTRLVVDGDALLAAAYPVVVDPEIGSNDYRISDMGGTGDPLYGAFQPSVVYNPRRNEYLVVWRGDDNVGGVVDEEFEVFSQRFTPDVVGLGPNDFRLSDVGGLGDPNYEVIGGPEVAYSPILDQYLVVWSGEDNVGGMINGEWEIFAQMLNGNVSDGIGPNDERISDAGGIGELSFTTSSPVVAANTWNGQFLVAWHGDDDVGNLVHGEWEIFIQRMDGMAVFVDAFESGDTSAWSSAFP